MLDGLKDFFGTGISEEDYGKLKGRLYEENRKNLIFLSGILFILLIPGTIFIYFYYGAGARFWIYVSILFCQVLSHVLAKAGRKKKPADSNFQIYLFSSILIGYSILLSTVMNSDMMAVKYIAFILALPMFFTDRPVRIGVYIGGCTAVFILCAAAFDARNVLVPDISQALFFGMISVITSTYLTRVKIQRLYFEWKWKVLSETDLMTGLNSRNRYEQDFNHFPKWCRETLCCVFLDVNGLHEADVNLGYDAGDRMLKTTASLFRAEFGEEYTYRIGGDEFVAILPDAGEDRVRQGISRIYSGTKRSGFSVSMGVAWMKKDQIDMNALTKAAAAEMSEVKRRHYRNGKNDRRSR